MRKPTINASEDDEVHMVDSNVWEFIEQNIIEFNIGLDNEDFFAVKHFSSFAHWYYHPTLDLFGPSKFIGYPNTTHEDYSGNGHGGETQQILRKFFNPVDQKEYPFYLSKLQLFAEKYNLRICNKTIAGHQGWIYLPKEEIVGQLSNSLLSIENDINSFESDFEDITMVEGKKRNILVNTYERNARLRKQTINFHGVTCMACKFNFQVKYGKHGENFIEVHHINPLSRTKDEHIVNPKTDMVVLCSNCHRMVHRDQENPLTIEELRRIITENER